MADARASAVIDLGAIRANYERVLEQAGSAMVIPVVKAQAYGHGMVPVARELRACGATLLGVALPSEALALRESGDAGALLAWLWTPGDLAVAECARRGVDLGASSAGALRELAAIGRDLGQAVRVHLKVDTGLTRNGAAVSEWPEVAEAAVRAERQGEVDVVGVWSHLADGEVPASDTTDRQATAFDEALATAREFGLSPRLTHLANSGAAWTRPGWSYTALRSGIALYGLTPGLALGSSAELGLVPAMTLRARLAHVKEVPAGTSVSYGGTWTAAAPTVVGLVPLGYADGIARNAGGRAEVLVGGRRVPVVGRVAMDQFVVDLGPGAVECAGDEVICFGPGGQGEPTAEDWAEAVGTIGYEIVTRIGARVPREFVGGTAGGER